jgi:hypothetical protein
LTVVHGDGIGERLGDNDRRRDDGGGEDFVGKDFVHNRTLSLKNDYEIMTWRIHIKYSD